MKVLSDIKDLIEEELKDIKKRGSLTPAELESVYKAVQTIKYIDDICDKDNKENEFDENGYSGRMSGYHMKPSMMYSGSYVPMIDDSAYTTAAYHMRPNYDNYRANSGCYDRDRYSGRSDYSDRNHMYTREGATSHMVSKLEDMMDTACTERERDAIRSCINKLI